MALMSNQAILIGGGAVAACLLYQIIVLRSMVAHDTSLLFLRMEGLHNELAITSKRSKEIAGSLGAQGTTLESLARGNALLRGIAKRMETVSEYKRFSLDAEAIDSNCRSAYVFPAPTYFTPSYTPTGASYYVGDDRHSEVVFLVLSARENAANRDRMRKKWVPIVQLHHHATLKFLVSAHRYEYEQCHTREFMEREAAVSAALFAESHMYGDLIVVPEVDCYRCSSRKLSAGLVEIEKAYKSLRVLVKLDDDVDVGRSRAVWETIAGYDAWNSEIKAFGLMRRAQPAPCGKWGYRKDQQPEGVVEYPQGALYLLSRPAVQLISQARINGTLNVRLWGEDLAVGEWLDLINQRSRRVHSELLGWSDLENSTESRSDP